MLNGRMPELIRPGSSKRVWWRCGHGHQWMATVSNRVYRGSSCPTCALEARRAPGPGRSLAEVAPEMAAQWHPTRNGDLGPLDVPAGSHVDVWWMCEIGHEWRSRVAGRVRRRGGVRSVLRHGGVGAVAGRRGQVRPRRAARTGPSRVGCRARWRRLPSMWRTHLVPQPPQSVARCTPTRRLVAAQSETARLICDAFR